MTRDAETDRIREIRLWVAGAADRYGPLAPEPRTDLETNNQAWWRDCQHLLVALDFHQNALSEWAADTRRMEGQRDGYMLLLDRLADAYKRGDKPEQSEALVAILNAFDAENHPTTLERPADTVTCPTCHGWGWIGDAGASSVPTTEAGQ